jgi:sarcosine oxidase, subunit alpha
VLPGDRAALVTTNDRGIEAADVLRASGADVARTLGPGEDLSMLVEAAELVLVAGGWNPNLSLWRAIGGDVRYDARRACFRPADGPPWLEVVGAADGDWLPETEPYWLDTGADHSEHFVDLQRDQTVADVAAALEAGLTSIEHVKRATYIGTAIDQGRTSGVLTAAIVNELLGVGPDAQGPTGARPPAVPVSYATIAGPDRGELLDPIRVTRIHPWHVERGAVFEDVGQWKRQR